jgi:hypothetical protein
MQPGEDRAGQIVLGFARAVVAGDFDTAHGLLTPSLQATMSPARLAHEYERMLSIYQGRRPTTVELVMTDPCLDGHTGSRRISAGHTLQSSVMTGPRRSQAWSKATVGET